MVEILTHVRGRNGFSFYKMSIKQEYAKIIDDFFSMYGYKVNEVKIPNVTGRTNWNYVKTIDANILGDIPQEDMVISDPIQQGDTVIHAKYGSGVVEKMIKYGNKTLFSINFDNIGRRLLDPTLTEIKKIILLKT